MAAHRTVRLTNEEDKQLETEAKKRGVTVSQLIRERLFPTVTAADFEVYRQDQRQGLERLCELAMQLIGYQRFAVNVSAKCLLMLDPQGAAGKLEDLRKRMEAEQQEAQKYHE